MEVSTKKINAAQEEWYKNGELSLVDTYIGLYSNGMIGIIDNLNDGFLWDQASCRILYFLTTTQNPLAVKLCKKMGSNSAGVGVCMLSRKMWHRLVNSAGMEIVDSIDSEPDELGVLKRVCLVNKSYREFNLMVL